MTISAPGTGTLDPESFSAIADLAYRESGLTLAEEKAQMIQSRLRHRLRDLGFDSFHQYSQFVSSEDGVGERRQLISALTTNVSHFFREMHHFDMLQQAGKAALPALRGGGRFRVWSAGCSNGQEPLSAAITLLDHLPELRDLDVRLLATDIDPKVIRFAQNGHYPHHLLQDIPDGLRNRFFVQIQDRGGHIEPIYEPREAIHDLITYRELNLLRDWPMKGPFNAILCRNVVIYFDEVTQTNLWPRFRRMLAPGGLLMLGHSERITQPERFGLALAGPTTYRAV